MGLHPCAADPHHLVVMRCLHPAPLKYQFEPAVLLACWNPPKHHVCVQGLGRVTDIIRVWGWVWVMLQRGLVCIKTPPKKRRNP